MLDQGQKVWIHVFAWEKKISCTYQKEKRLKQREIQKWVEALILVIGDVSPT